MKRLFLCALSLLPSHLSAQPCNWDPTFGNNGKTSFPMGTLNESINGIGIQTDINGTKKIVVAGTVYWQGPGANTRIGLARLTTDGVLDNSFGNGGKIMYDYDPNLGDWATDMAILPDNSIITCGISFNRVLLAKFDGNGFIDTTFGNQGFVVGAPNNMEFAYSIATQPDGKIVICGRKTQAVLHYDFALARFNPDGSPDITFGNNGGLVTVTGLGSNVAMDLLVQPDGKILVGGFRENVLGSANYGFVLVRYESNGQLDNSFGVNGISDPAIGPNSSILNSIVLQPDGKIVAGGVDDFTGILDCALVRYLPNGNLDSDFGINGVYIGDRGMGGEDQIIDLALQPDGKIVATGHAGDDFMLIRFDTMGQPESLFDSCTLDFYGASDIGTSVALYDNKIVIGGIATINNQQDFALAQYQNDINVGVEAVEEHAGMTIFPNPTSGTAVLQFDGTSNGILEITNLEGQLILRQQLPNGPTQEINLSGQHSGLYLVKVVHDGEVFVAKLLVRK